MGQSSSRFFKQIISSKQAPKQIRVEEEKKDSSPLHAKTAISNSDDLGLSDSLLVQIDPQQKVKTQEPPSDKPQLTIRPRTKQILATTGAFILGSTAIGGVARLVITDINGKNDPFIALLSYFGIGYSTEILIHQFPEHARATANYLHQEHIPIISVLEALTVSFFLGGWQNSTALTFLAVFSSAYTGLIHATKLQRFISKILTNSPQNQQLVIVSQESSNEEKEEKSESYRQRFTSWMYKRKDRILMSLAGIACILLGHRGFNIFPENTVSISLSDMGFALLGYYYLGKPFSNTAINRKYNQYFNIINDLFFFGMIDPGHPIQISILGGLMGCNRANVKARLARQHTMIAQDEKMILELHSKFPEFFAEVENMMNIFNKMPTKNIIYNPDYRPVDKWIKGFILFLVVAFASVSWLTGNIANGLGATFLLATYFLAHQVERTPYQEYKERDNQNLKNKISWGLFYLLRQNPRLIIVFYGYILQHWHNYPTEILLVAVTTINCVLIAMAVSWQYHTPYLGEILTNLKDILEKAEKNTTMDVNILTNHQLRLIDGMLEELKLKTAPNMRREHKTVYRALENNGLVFRISPQEEKNAHLNEVSTDVGKTSFGVDLMRAIAPLIEHCVIM